MQGAFFIRYKCVDEISVVKNEIAIHKLRFLVVAVLLMGFNWSSTSAKLCNQNTPNDGNL